METGLLINQVVKVRRVSASQSGRLAAEMEDQ